MKKKILIVEIILIVSLVILALLVAFDMGTLKTVEDKPDEIAVEEEPVVPEEKLEVEEEPEDKPITLCFTGDVEISTYVQDNYDKAGVDGVLSSELQALLSQSDVTMINNEFCYSTRGEQAQDKQFTFRVDPSYVSLLTDMGVDVAGLANNHVLDFGKDALTDTFSTLNSAGIDYTGSGVDVDDASKLVIKEVSGKKIGYLAASRVIPFGHWNVESSTPGVFACYDPTKLVKAVEAAKAECDYVFVMVHWGIERTDILEDHQTQIGHALVDAGADAVIGMHSHCLQPIEYYNGAPIFYSLGNFIFNQSIGSTVVVQLSIDEDELEVRLVPAAAADALTRELTGQDGEAVFGYLESISPTVSIDEDGVMTSK